jgi:hypothetical protein
MVSLMTELEVMRVLEFVSGAAVAVPVAILAFRVWQNSTPRSIVFVDREGKVVKEITADSVQRLDTNELVRLHDRIRRNNDITISTRAA